MRRRPTVATRRRQGPDTVVILDFGSQFAQLIARRVRELNVYSELLPHDTPWEEIRRRNPKAIILSGSPASVYDADAPKADPAVWAGQVPVLGICYGIQLMAHELGGEVLPSDHREYGPAAISISAADGLFAGLEREQPVWMSHGDQHRAAAGRASPPPRRRSRRRAPASPIPRAACTASSSTRRWCTRRTVATILRNFVIGVAGARPTWTAGNFIDTTDRPGSRAGRRRARDLRAVGWRRLGSRGHARAPRDRRPADLHLRRPRPDAQARVRAAAHDLRASTSACSS